MSGHATINEPVTTYVVTATYAARAWQLAAYPNPASTQLTVAVEGGGAGPLHASLLNALGQRVRAQVALSPATPRVFDLAELRAGVYYLRVEGAGVSATEKVVVTR